MSTAATARTFQRPTTYRGIIRAIDGRRHWASGRAPSLRERAAAFTGSALPPYPLPRVRSTALDADVLIKEMLASLRRGRPVALTTLAEGEELRVFAPREVVASVDRHLRRAAVEAQVAPDVAVEVWATLRTHVRVVSVPERAAHPALLERDATDVPTAYLASVVGHCWSNDHDLTDLQLARRYSLDVALPMREAIESERTFYASVTISAAALEGTAQAARAAWSFASRHPVLALGAGALLALLLERFVVHERAKAGAWLNAVVEGTAPMREAAGQALRHYEELLARLPPTPAIEAVLPLEIAVGRVLATAPLPLSVSEIREALAETHPVSEPVIRDVLRSPLFVRTSVGRWQLGWW